MAESLPNDMFPSLSKRDALVKALARIRAAKAQRSNQYFLDKTIYLDGYKFTNCRFDRCNLIIYSGDISLDHCVISNDCIVSYGENALKIVRLFNSFNPSSHIYFPNLTPIVNADGTISIKGVAG
ncbi:hypothetical protein ACFL31_01905 [Candidatus Margulisiibacteriota bacterium]